MEAARAELESRGVTFVRHVDAALPGRFTDPTATRSAANRYAPTARSRRASLGRRPQAPSRS